jgi:hypothetical protein
MSVQAIFPSRRIVRVHVGDVVAVTWEASLLELELAFAAWSLIDGLEMIEGADTRLLAVPEGDTSSTIKGEFLKGMSTRVRLTCRPKP